MLSIFTIFFTSFVIALSGALMPGPLLTVTISESARRGFVAGPLLIAGHGLLELALVVALLLGLAPLLQHHTVFVLIALIGSGVLLWMAYGMFRTLPTLSLSTTERAESRSNLLVTGALVSIANPYWSIWWVTIGLGYILHCTKFGKLGIASFFSGHILADLAWYALISAAVWKGEKFLSDRAYRWVIGICAALLVVFSGLFLYVGISRIAR
jgi:threonine/homoserine/homoserine lactone efflux protein